MKTKRATITMTMYENHEDDDDNADNDDHNDFKKQYFFNEKNA